MAEDAAEVIFHAVISAKDEASSILRDLGEKFGLLGRKAVQAGQMTEHLHHPHVFEALTGHVNLLRSHFGNLRVGIGEVASSFQEFLPVLAGLGAAGSLAGMAELVEHVAEQRGEFLHTAAEIGVSSQALQRLDYMAKVTDTNLDRMHLSMTKLNKVIADANGGSNKNALALFHRLGIHLRDANGQLRDANDLMPKLENAFYRTGSADMRGKMAMALFGRGGVDMIPMLSMGAKKLKELGDEGNRLQYIFSNSDNAGLEKYNESMKKIKMAVGSFGDEISARVAPVLQPIVDGITDWVTVNRSWIATDIAKEVRLLGGWLGRIDFNGAIRGATNFAHQTLEVADHLGGVRVALGAVGLVMGASFLAPLVQLGLHMASLAKFMIGPLISSFVEVGAALATGQDAWVAFQLVFVANPFGVIIAGAAALGAAVYELWDHWAWVERQFSGLFDWFSHQNGWVQALIAISFPVVGLPLVIMDHWSGIRAFFSALWDDITHIFDAAWKRIKPITDALTDAAHWIRDAGGNGSDTPGGAPGYHSHGGGGLLATHGPLIGPGAPGRGGAGGLGGPGGAGGSAGTVDVNVTVNGLPPGSHVQTVSRGGVQAHAATGQAFQGR